MTRQKSKFCIFYILKRYVAYVLLALPFVLREDCLSSATRWATLRFVDIRMGKLDRVIMELGSGSRSWVGDGVCESWRTEMRMFGRECLGGLPLPCLKFVYLGLSTCLTGCL